MYSKDKIKKGVFTEKDFTLLFLVKLRERCICSLDSNKIESQLYSYFNDTKYKPLFSNINASGDCNQINLQESLDYYKKIYLLFCNSAEPNILNINIPKETLDSINNSNDQNYANIMQDLVIDYDLKRKLEKEQHINLNIFGFNPNNYYLLLHGKHSNSIIDWQVITDGILMYNELNSDETNGLVYCTNPEKEDSYLCLSETIMRNIVIDDATFATIQGLKNDALCMANLYTLESDQNILKQMTQISGIHPMEKCVLTTSKKPYVYSYKLK
jgi:hypothetical protein